MTPLHASAAMPLTAWWKIPWQDWLGVVGTVLGVIGLGFTLVQVVLAKRAAREAKTAAQAATDAVVATQIQLRANMQLILIPGLQRVSQELDDAIHRGSQQDARASLDRWRFQAGHVRGLLRQETPEPRSVLKALQESVAQSAVAGEQLLAAKPLLDSCKKARQAIATACDEVTQLAGKNVTQVRTQGTET